MKKTSYGVSLVRPKRRKMDWKRWVKDFLSGRTHVLYGQTAAFVIALYFMSVFYAKETVNFAVALLLAFIILASATDLVAHLYYH